MKKSVRIRKALPGEKPGYYNKTAKFLKKAQMGMEINSPSNDPQRLKTIYTNVYASLMSDITPDVIYNSLIGEYALDENTALMLLRSALEKLVEEGKIDPESLEGDSSQQNQKQEEQPSETQDRESQEEYDQRMSEDAEQDELAMSDEDYYDEEEAVNNDNSHLDTEEEQQQQAFAFGGYYDNGGESDEDYSDYYDDSNQSSSPESAVINQYNNPGQNKMKKPFSMEDLINMTPGIQGTQAIPGIEDYLGHYRPISESYNTMDYLPRAQDGLQMLPGLTRQFNKALESFNKGYSAVRGLVPMTNMSAIRKAAPLATLTGQALTKVPYVGPKLSPALKTTFTQNRNHLWEVLNGASPNQEIFGNVGTRANPDGSLQVNRLLLYQHDLNNILSVLDRPLTQTELSEGLPRVFKLGEIDPIAASDGLVSGVYPMDSKVTGGTDDQGNKFFELSYKFGPNQRLPFGSTSNKARELTFKNRFYYTTVVDPTTNQTSYKVFGPLGEDLTPGIQTKFEVTRPMGTTVFRSLTDPILAERRGYKYPNTPFPGRQGLFHNPDNTRSFEDRGGMNSKVIETMGQKPKTFADMGVMGKIGRGLETFAFTGLNLPFRTKARDIQKVEYPVFGYTSSALGPNVLNPALETGVASDIANAINYKYRIGRNALIGAGGLGYLGYRTYDAFANPCQCEDENKPNYMKLDAFGKCPCGTDVGNRRTLDPTGIPKTEQIDQNKLTFPDSMQFLIQRGIAPTDYNYWRYRDSLDLNKSKNSFSDDYAKGGQIPKYQPGGGVGLLQRYTQGLDEARRLYNTYRNAPYGQFAPIDLKNARRNLNLPEFLTNERLAQDAARYWPSRAEIEDALDIQERILSGTLSGAIPETLWRRNINQQIFPLQYQNTSDMPGLSMALSMVSEPPPLPSIEPITEITLQDLKNLDGAQLEEFRKRRQQLNSFGAPHPFKVTAPSGEISVTPRIHGDSDPNEYSFYANMRNPMEAGQALINIGKYAFTGANPIIRPRDSLSLDSFPLLTNLGRRKDWALQPIHKYGVEQGEYGPVGPQDRIPLNSMTKHNKLLFGPNNVGLNPNAVFSPHISYTEAQKNHILDLLNQRLIERGLVDFSGNSAKMTADPVDMYNDKSIYRFYFPAYRARRNYRQGGITERQFIKAFSSKFQDGGPQDQSLGKGKRMDTLTNDVESRKDIFKSKLKDNSNVALTKEIYKNAQNNPQILNMLMQDGPKENLAEDTGMQIAARGGVPDWYTGYNTALSPKEYRKLYRKMKRMIPRGLDISRANMASNFYDNRFMQPGYGAVVSTPEYMDMLAMSSLPLYKSADNIYGADRKPSDSQADEATTINNEKGIPLLPEMTPDFIDSPLVGNPQDVEDYFRNKRAPILGETYDTWYTSDGSTPGFAPDTRTWDGTQWVGPSPSERMQLENREQGGFVDMDAENPLVRFIYGGDETGYYEPEDLPGQNIMNKDLEQRVVGDKLSYDEWLKGEREDWIDESDPNAEETWQKLLKQNSPKFQEDFKKYEDFYAKSLYDYMNFDDPNVNPNSNNTNNNTQNGKNCPQGYTWNGKECVKAGSNSGNKCGPGTVWNATYNACIPVAQVTYNPRVVRGQSGLFRNLAPWNPAFGYAGSWTKQMSLPYQLGSGNPYMGQLTGAPAARYVTKKGIFGKPKKWIDIYDVNGSGEAINPLEIEQLVGQQGRGSDRMNTPKEPGRRDMLQQYAQDQFNFTDDEWQNETGDSRRDMMRSVRQDMRADRRQDRRDNRERMFPRMRAIDADRNPRSGFAGMFAKKNKSQYGGDLNEYGPGGINDPSYPGGYNPFSLGQGFSMGVGQNTSAFAPHSADAQFQNELMGGNGPSKLPPQQQNPFAFVTGTGTGSYAETANTGHTLGAQGQEIIPQKVSPNNKRNLVGVENKRKDMVNFDPESLLNQTNAFARGALNLFDPEKKRQCGPGTTWNSSTQTCQPTDAMDIYATATEQDRGDWTDIGSKAGLYRYDQMGQDRSSRATFGQYGGYMQDGGFYDPYYEEDEEVIMTPEELEQFLAAGGQVEYL